MRFVFCAAVICYVLQDWSGIDMTRVEEFIKNSLVRIRLEHKEVELPLTFCCRAMKVGLHKDLA